jgi:outer membrane protein OmpA-like peptidoglycan-associated protein
MKQNMILLILAFTASTLWSQQATEALNLEYVYEEGEQYRVLSTVEQDVWVNGDYSHSATILNRISVTVTEVEAGRGYHDATFVTSEESIGMANSARVFAWGQEYESEFRRDRLGYFDIDPRYFMPVVRDVPVFPDRPVRPGDTWSADGHEVHDFRSSFGIPEPYRFPIPVTYEYRDVVEREGREYALLEVSYNVFYRPDRTYPGAMYPVRISGYSDQLIYWDIRAGRPHEYEEEYALVFVFSTGDEVIYEGTAEARVIEASRMDRSRIADEVRRDLDELGYEDQDVVEDERGVTIRLDRILFPPDSDFLRDGEKDKLRDIAEILRRYPERDLLIGGHTALAGTEAGRQQLSEDRAAAVANFLLEIGVRARDQMILRGFGATEPVADNATEEGRRRNRRVELTILEN